MTKPAAGKLYDAETRSVLCSDLPHGIRSVSRERVMSADRWLKNGKGDFHEQPVKTYPNHELLVHALAVSKMNRKPKADQLILDTSTQKAGDPAELLAELYAEDPYGRFGPRQNSGGIG